MRRLTTFSFLATLCLATTFAQSFTGYVGNAFYRVHNFKTGRYIYITDNKDHTDLNLGTSEDLQALQLWMYLDSALFKPASVIYMEQQKDKNGNFINQYDLRSQGAGVHALTGHYVSVSKKSDGTYEVYATKSTVTEYLSDNEQSDDEQGLMSTAGKMLYRRWVVDKIETNHATNYFGLKPTAPAVQLNGKYYLPFYADFAFKTVSPDMHVYYISKVEGNEVVMKEIVGEIPAATPVIIEFTSQNTSDNRLDILLSSTAKVTGNKLAGVYFCNGERPKGSTNAYTKFDAATMRLLTVKDNKLVFSNDAPNRLKTLLVTDWTTYDDVPTPCIYANTSYLKADSSTPAELEVRVEGSGIDEILAESKDKSVEGVYTISGTQLRPTNDVKGLPAGLYIVGGHKFVIK